MMDILHVHPDLHERMGHIKRQEALRSARAGSGGRSAGCCASWAARWSVWASGCSSMARRRPLWNDARRVSPRHRRLSTRAEKPPYRWPPYASATLPESHEFLLRTLMIVTTSPVSGIMCACTPRRSVCVAVCPAVALPGA